jgi:hypothetical protein
MQEASFPIGNDVELIFVGFKQLHDSLGSVSDPFIVVSSLTPSEDDGITLGSRFENAGIVLLVGQILIGVVAEAELVGEDGEKVQDHHSAIDLQSGDVIDREGCGRVLNDVIGQTGLETDDSGHGLLLVPYSLPEVAVGVFIVEHGFAFDGVFFGYHIDSSYQ